MTRAMCIVVASLALAGCAPDAWVEFEVLTDMPPGAVLQADGIRVPQGWAVGVEAIPIESNERVEVVLDLVVSDPSRVGIDRGLQENHFIIYGVGEGSTSIDIYFDDELIGEMPATAIDQ